MNVAIAIVLGLAQLNPHPALVSPQYSEVDCIVEGRVSEGDRSATGVEVRLSSEHGVARMRTDDTGNFRLGVPSIGNAMIQFVRDETEAERPTYLRMRRQTTTQAVHATRVDINIRPGTAAIEGVLRQNGKPVSNGAALLEAEIDATTTYSICTLTDANGAYRLEGLPAGTHILTLDARPNQLSVAIARMHKASRQRSVTLADGEVLKHDYDRQTGEFTAQLKGIGADEVARVVVVPGEFAGGKLSAALIRGIVERAVHSVEVLRDRSVIVPDLDVGAYTVYLAAFDRRSGNFTSVLKTMRLTFANVQVRPDTTPSLLLALD
ncbi:MAG TPA: hypothetical protein PLJ47_05860 [Candidatus Hydrogenedentes bacterium]|nr:hypothetical protein [Candidatus Hydrogenedentota bacterium]HRK34103.1 hypothetical protein [Candidatus Hydrogenedentota bacterium]